jgi:hypothetical protein
MDILLRMHFAARALPEWLYGRRWLIGLSVALMLGLALSQTRGSFTA